VAPVNRRKSGGGGAILVALISMLIALVAVGVSAFVMISQPEGAPDPVQSPEVMPGGTTERVAKLEKDVSGLILRLVTLEKELRAVSSKAGSVTQLTELTAKMAAIQSRLDSLTVRSRLATSASGGGAAASQPAPQPTIKPALPPQLNTASVQSRPATPKPAASQPKPSAKKMVYTVRSGDSLFDIALRYKVSVRNLKAWNKMRSNKIVAGQRLVIYK
jgi:LysM repeat protein